MSERKKIDTQKLLTTKRSCGQVTSLFLLVLSFTEAGTFCVDPKSKHNG